MNQIYGLKFSKPSKFKDYHYSDVFVPPDETPLVIAVCVLGTLVGVVVVVAAVALALRSGCCGDLLDLRLSYSGRRSRSRAGRELGELVAAPSNFISDSMLPGNRTGKHYCKH